MNNQNKLFFLGSGFSKAINPMYPTLKELTDITINNFKKNNHDTALEKHFEEIPNIVKKDIEQLLSFLYTNYPWKNSIEKSLNLALFKSLTIEIANHLKTINTKWMPQNTTKFFQCIKDGAIPVITLNYDTLIEDFNTYYEMEYNCKFKFGEIILIIEDNYYIKRKTSFREPYVSTEEKIHISGALQTIHTQYPNLPKLNIFIDGCYLYKADFDDFRQIFINFGVDEYITLENDFKELFKQIKELFKTELFSKHRNSINLIKLHGSIDTNCIEKEDGSIEVLDGWESLYNAYSKISMPYIIPPVLDKNIFYKDRRINLKWTQAHELIKKADEIYIVGFSFPETDTSVRFLFQSALSCSKAQIYVINTATKESLEKNYKKVFMANSFSPSYTLNYDYCGLDNAFGSFAENILNESNITNPNSNTHHPFHLA